MINVSDKKNARFSNEETMKRERFISRYTNFKSGVNITRIKLKSECSIVELEEMTEILEQCKIEVEQAYESLRTLTTPLPDIRMKMDTCTSVISEVIIVLKERQKGSYQTSIQSLSKNPSPSHCRGKMSGPFMAQLCPDSVEVAAKNFKYSQRRLRQLRVWLLNGQKSTEMKFLC